MKEEGVANSELGGSGDKASLSSVGDSPEFHSQDEPLKGSILLCGVGAGMKLHPSNSTSRV